MRSEKVQSQLAYRGTQEDWLAGGVGALDQARRMVVEMLARESVGLSDDFAGAAREIVADSARRMGLGKAPDIAEILAACRP